MNRNVQYDHFLFPSIENEVKELKKQALVSYLWGLWFLNPPHWPHFLFRFQHICGHNDQRAWPSSFASQWIYKYGVHSKTQTRIAWRCTSNRQCSASAASKAIVGFEMVDVMNPNHTCRKTFQKNWKKFRGKKIVIKNSWWNFCTNVIKLFGFSIQ